MVCGFNENNNLSSRGGRTRERLFGEHDGGRVAVAEHDVDVGRGGRRGDVVVVAVTRCAGHGVALVVVAQVDDGADAVVEPPVSGDGGVGVRSRVAHNDDVGLGKPHHPALVFEVAGHAVAQHFHELVGRVGSVGPGKVERDDVRCVPIMSVHPLRQCVQAVALAVGGEEAGQGILSQESKVVRFTRVAKVFVVPAEKPVRSPWGFREPLVPGLGLPVAQARLRDALLFLGPTLERDGGVLDPLGVGLMSAAHPTVEGLFPFEGVEVARKGFLARVEALAVALIGGDLSDMRCAEEHGGAVKLVDRAGSCITRHWIAARSGSRTVPPCWV